MKFPDCFTEGSIPAKAASFFAEENLFMSPISLKITAPRTGPMPGNSVRLLLYEEKNFEMQPSSTFI